MHRICLFFIGVLFSLSATSQDFDYSFSKDSVGWQELNNQTILNGNNAAWNFFYNVPIGFTFNYLGRDFDHLRIETNGYLVFDEDRSYAFTAFNFFSDCDDEQGNHSVLGYELSGSTGNQILKIQFKNVGFWMEPSEYFSYQVWIKESGSIEVHVGPNDYQYASVVNGNDTVYVNADSSVVYRIGLLNMNMDGETNGFFIGGDITSPQSQPVNSNFPDAIFFLRAPSMGTRYTFTPNFN